jgi:hypothetical protein
MIGAISLSFSSDIRDARKGLLDLCSPRLRGGTAAKGLLVSYFQDKY